LRIFRRELQGRFLLVLPGRLLNARCNGAEWLPLAPALQLAALLASGACASISNFHGGSCFVEQA
jgi:hypothetical protein